MGWVSSIEIFFCQFHWLQNWFLKNSTCQVRKDWTTLQTPPLFFNSPIYYRRSETHLKSYLPSHSLPMQAGKNLVSALIMSFWKTVPVWFYGQEIVFNVPRALQNVSFQNYIHLSLLKILSYVNKSLKNIVVSKNYIFSLCHQWKMRFHNIRLEKPRVKI